MEKWQPDEKYWQVGDAVAWIVYRVEPDQAPETIIPDVGNGRMTSRTLMAALEARASGNPRSWPTSAGPVLTSGYARDFEPPVPAFQVRAIVRRWMREEKLDAVGLLALATADRTKYEADKITSAQQQALFSKARRALNAASRQGLITVLARPAKTWDHRGSKAERETVRATVFDEHRGVDPFGSIRIDSESGFDFLRDTGPFFHDSIFVISEIKKVWPALPAAAVTVAAVARLQQWLEVRMRASPTVSPGKAAVKKMAAIAGHLATGRPFDRAWALAVQATGAVAWATAGRKSKR